MKTSNSTTTSKVTNLASHPPITAKPVASEKTHSAEGVKAPHIDARRFALKSKNLAKGANFDAELLQVVTSNIDNSTADRALRTIAIKAAQGVGAAHILRENELWTLTADRVTGRVPTNDALVEECGDQLQEFVESESPSVLKLECLEGLPAVFLSLRSAKQPELFMVTLKDSADLTSTFAKLQKVVSALQLIRKNSTLNNSMWQLNSLAAIMELVGKIEKSDTLKSACEMASNELVSLLGCESAAIALFHKRKLKLNAISGIAKIDRASRTCRDYQQALYESVVRDQQGTYPAHDTDNGHLLLAHKQLTSTVQSQSAISQPLANDDDDAIGSWIFTGSQSQLASEHFARFIDTATPHISGALDLLRRAEKSRWKRMWSLFTRKTKLFTRLMIPISLIAFFLLMQVPITYKVRCNCTVEPVLRRFAVAAFDGLVESGFVEPGDLVEKDQVLAEIDGRTIRWELLGVSSERKQSLRQREIELADRNIPKTLLRNLRTGD